MHVQFSITGEKLFDGFPLNIAGKTGTAQGAANLPWNDSSAFAAFGLDEAAPYTVTAYLEKAGYGSKAAAPVTKCIFEALADPTMLPLVQVSDTLDLSSTLPAASNMLVDTRCLARVADGVKG